jgi:RHH-type transcriptional regulator, proline utilization regulon repressor / proline dehydrogenase / delta 1-pyrroline-5-carboxylate dehydrogenase
MALPNRDRIDSALFADELNLAQSLARDAKLDAAQDVLVFQKASALVQSVRAKRTSQGGIDAFMLEYSLSSDEGVVLMCLAEALLRIPDSATVDKLIADKIGGRDWESHLGQSESLFVNASAWGLMLTGRIVTLGDDISSDAFGFVKRFVRRSGEPVLRSAMKQAMRIMGRQFVLGQNIKEALDISAPSVRDGYRYSFDMLGESAMTIDDAATYFKSYRNALEEMAKQRLKGFEFSNSSLSVKLSALHPRYEQKQATIAVPHLFAGLLELAEFAKLHHLGLTIDAEEVARLDLSLELFAMLAQAESLRGWNGLGLAVQAYGKRAKPTLEWLADLAKHTGRKLPVRLVKGAYWDTEIKRAQEQGLEDFPLFTRKDATDVSYLACARFMLSRRELFFPQFATHNAQSVASVMVMAGDKTGFEFQRLHGMGVALYSDIVGTYPCRVYAPVGSHKDLLGYLVRRLLENGANTSFVNRIADDDAPIETLVANPVDAILQQTEISNSRIRKPAALFYPRVNSKGIALWRNSDRKAVTGAVEKHLQVPCFASTLINGEGRNDGPLRSVFSPHDVSRKIGTVAEASDAAAAEAMASAAVHQPHWCGLGGAARADILEKAALALEANRDLLLALLVGEAGKTLENALGDLREAVDFLRYYAAQARGLFSAAVVLPGPTGERNELTLHGRGVFVCISPWNFPLAIFTGQISAALAAGNAVVAKPAEQTPLIAHQVIKLLHEAGVPPEILQFVPGDGARLGNILLSHKALAGVVFTGSTETARIINRSLALRDGAIPVLIAETGGMNAMIVDSSSLPEQAVRDAVASAFDSAGQRCSAARILFVQRDIAPRIIDMLKGAMAELRLGDPLDYSTDIGPVIDQEAKDILEKHKVAMARAGKLIYEVPIPDRCKAGYYVAPAAYELASIDELKREVFGPVLHVVRFESSMLDEVCDSLNAKGFGLTLGLHTRIESVVKQVRARMKVGNLYVNRNQIGAVVGAQPFGGEGLSGTGPKAGGPHYLVRFAVERVCAIDTTASGGNAELLSL